MKISRQEPPKAFSPYSISILIESAADKDILLAIADLLAHQPMSIYTIGRQIKDTVNEQVSI